MSNRIVAIKILGLGEDFSSDPATFTTRAHPTLYPYAVNGSVVSLTDQLSSEIAVFGNMGSDSTTSFTVLSTNATRALLMSRGRVEVLDPSNDNQPLRVQDYILPDPGPVTLTGVDGTNLVVGGYYRIQNTAFICTSTSPVIFDRTWGSAAVPIPMAIESSLGNLIGSKIYNVSGNKPRGGCEQLPVVIETVDLDSTQPEVIFRGYISKVTNDTSNGQPNLIKVDCSSMMAYLKSAPFVPSWGDVSVTLKQGIGRVIDAEGQATVANAYVQTDYDSRLYGAIYDPMTPVTGATKVKLWQIRQEGKGGIGAADITSQPGKVVIKSDYNITYSGTATARDNGYRMFFDDGYFADGNQGPVLDFGVDIQPVRNTTRGGARIGYYRNRTQNTQPGMRGENCIEAMSLGPLIIDLLLGSYNADISMASGARSASESAWLPFTVNNWTDIIDAPSLYALISGLTTPDVPIMNPELSISLNDSLSTLLPYQHTSAKTVGQVLEEILKRLAAYMVYDKGKFYFGSWAGARQTPVQVNDSALSDPAIRLTYDRGMSIMRVNAKYCTDMAEKPVTFEVPFQNIDLANAGLGKVVSVGHWQTNFFPPNEAPWSLSKMVANAFGMVMRYSQSAARVDLSLRDSVVDLDIGQEVALSSQYIVNSDGGMGISQLTGYVLKAARSWQTPTTAYTIILPGYLSPAAHVSVWSCSGLVVDVPSDDSVQLEANFFTPVPLAQSPGTPASDTEAFRRTADLYGGLYDVQVLDQYLTLKNQFTLTNIDVPGNKLEAINLGLTAMPGDIVLLAQANYFFSGVDTLWDVFQADTGGYVVGSQANARKWVR